jgi:excisionase family DNA binding protein
VSEKMISIADAARRLSVSELTVRRWIASGRLTGYRFGSRMIRIDSEELDHVARQIPTTGGA